MDIFLEMAQQKILRSRGLTAPFMLFCHMLEQRRNVFLQWLLISRSVAFYLFYHFTCSVMYRNNLFNSVRNFLSPSQIFDYAPACTLAWM